MLLKFTEERVQAAFVREDACVARFLEEFERDLRNSAFEHPVRLLIESLNILVRLRLSREFCGQFFLQNVAEKLDPWCTLLCLEQVG